MAGAFSALLWGLIVLSLLVVVHESGHYLVARLCGVRVTEFFLGMPFRWRLSVKSRRHGTEFGVTPILLGGYNRICGMESTEDELLADALDFVYRTGSVQCRDLRERFGIDDDRAYSILVTLADWASVRTSRDDDPDDPVFRTIPRDAAFLCEYDSGHDQAAIDAHADGDVYDLPFSPAELLSHERSHVYQGIGFGKRIAMLVMGAVVNIVFAIILVTFALSVVGIDYGSTEPVIGTVYEGSLAQQAGIQPGDRIVQMGGAGIESWYDISDVLDVLLPAGDDFDIVVERDGAEQTLHVTMPEGDAPELLGITNVVTKVTLPVGEALLSAFGYAGQVAEFALRLINPSTTMEVVDQSSSIVGMSVMASEAASTGAFDLMLVIAAISMSLGFMNLLPIPPLDGGKILFEVIQLIMGRPIPIKVQNIVSYEGLGLLLVLFVFVLHNDIIRYLL